MIATLCTRCALEREAEVQAMTNRSRPFRMRRGLHTPALHQISGRAQHYGTGIGTLGGLGQPAGVGPKAWFRSVFSSSNVNAMSGLAMSFSLHFFLSPCLNLSDKQLFPPVSTICRLVRFNWSKYTILAQALGASKEIRWRTSMKISGCCLSFLYVSGGS